jgi:DHA2 family multidrug resistance protein
MLVLGLSLFGTTVLLPQYLQLELGYTAELAGMALSPGAIAIVILLPAVGQLQSRVDARWLIAIGFTLVAASLFYMAHHFGPTIDFATAVRLRVFQSTGIAFLFVPINTLVYSHLPPEKNNQIAGIVNLSRNVGADLGITAVTATVAHRAQIYQQDLSVHTSRLDPALTEQLNEITTRLVHSGASHYQAVHQAYGEVYQALVAQATSIAYVNTIWLFAVASMCMVPLAFLAKSAKPEGGARMH